jgi:hypothetical protein
MTNDERLRRIDVLARAIRGVSLHYQAEYWEAMQDFSWGISMLASMPALWLDAKDAQLQAMEFRAAEIIAARDKQRTV